MCLTHCIFLWLCCYLWNQRMLTKTFPCKIVSIKCWCLHLIYEYDNVYHNYYKESLRNIATVKGILKCPPQHNLQTELNNKMNKISHWNIFWKPTSLLDFTKVTNQVSVKNFILANCSENIFLSRIFQTFRGSFSGNVFFGFCPGNRRTILYF